VEVRKGEFLALAGPSGCGKSTLLKLLLCLYAPDSGELVMDTHGKSRPLTAADRGLFAYVPQGNRLMSGTVRQALTFDDAEAMTREEKMWQALDTACAREFVAELPQGLDTVLGEQGAGLSEGQLQRLAVARAIFSGRPILLLDEATSALDGDAERRLLDNLRTMTDRTVVIVTHRPRALEVCDRVIRFGEGS
jgi:ATP-binding cassette subfamily B protein